MKHGYPCRPHAMRWQTASRLFEQIPVDQAGVWETEFLESVQGRIDAEQDLTEAQGEKLREIVDRYA